MGEGWVKDGLRRCEWGWGGGWESRGGGGEVAVLKLLFTVARHWRQPQVLEVSGVGQVGVLCVSCVVCVLQTSAAAAGLGATSGHQQSVTSHH